MYCLNLFAFVMKFALFRFLPIHVNMQLDTEDSWSGIICLYEHIICFLNPLFQLIRARSKESSLQSIQVLDLSQLDICE